MHLDDIDLFYGVGYVIHNIVLNIEAFSIIIVVKAIIEFQDDFNEKLKVNEEAATEFTIECGKESTIEFDKSIDFKN